MAKQLRNQYHPKFKGWYCKEGNDYPSAREASLKTGEKASKIIAHSKAGTNGWSFKSKNQGRIAFNPLAAKNNFHTNQEHKLFKSILSLIEPVNLNEDEIREYSFGIPKQPQDPEEPVIPLQYDGTFILNLETGTMEKIGE